MIHTQASEFAGKKVKIRADVDHPQGIAGQDFMVEDYWDRIAGKSWMFCNGNPACLIYALRTGLSKTPIPTDNEVLYGKVGAFGHLVHVSEIICDAYSAEER